MELQQQRTMQKQQQQQQFNKQQQQYNPEEQEERAKLYAALSRPTSLERKHFKIEQTSGYGGWDNYDMDDIEEAREILKMRERMHKKSQKGKNLTVWQDLP